jgi:hypothetical protein
VTSAGRVGLLADSGTPQLAFDAESSRARKSAGRAGAGGGSIVASNPTAERHGYSPDAPASPLSLNVKAFGVLWRVVRNVVRPSVRTFARAAGRRYTRVRTDNMVGSTDYLHRAVSTDSSFSPQLSLPLGASESGGNRRPLPWRSIKRDIAAFERLLQRRAAKPITRWFD